MKKICLISPKFNEHIGGMETHALEFARYFLKENEFKLTSIITGKNVKDGISVESNIEGELKELIDQALTGDFKKDLKRILKIAADADIYFFNSPNWLPLVKKLRELRSNSKIIVRSGGTDLIAGWIGDELNTNQNFNENKKNLANIINNYVDYLIVNSEFSKKRLLPLGITNKKIIKLIGGVDCNKFKPNPSRNLKEKIKIINASRIIKCKGLDLALEAIQRLNTKKISNIKFLILGDGPEIENLKNRIEILKIDHLVELVGAVNFDRVSDFYNNSNILLHLPINYLRKAGNFEYIQVESMGRIFCEAASAGLPAVSFKVGGVPEVVINEYSGFLLDEGDINSVVEKLSLLIKNSKLRDQMSTNSRRLAIKSFDWKYIFEKYKELFK